MIARSQYKVTINIAHNPIQHDRTKHIKIERTFYQGTIACRVDLHTM
jgi:hypothetical protein